MHCHLLQFVEQNKIDGFNKEELPMKTKRKSKNEHKKVKPSQKAPALKRDLLNLKIDLSSVTGRKTPLLEEETLTIQVLY